MERELFAPRYGGRRMWKERPYLKSKTPYREARNSVLRDKESRTRDQIYRTWDQQQTLYVTNNQ